MCLTPVLCEVSFLLQKYSGIQGGAWQGDGPFKPMATAGGCGGWDFLARKLSTNSESRPEAAPLVLEPPRQKMVLDFETVPSGRSRATRGFSERVVVRQKSYPDACEHLASRVPFGLVLNLTFSLFRKTFGESLFYILMSAVTFPF